MIYRDSAKQIKFQQYLRTKSKIPNKSNPLSKNSRRNKSILFSRGGGVGGWVVQGQILFSAQSYQIEIKEIRDSYITSLSV
jgi:hypothetical protein